MATFKYANTEAGRKAFEEGRSGARASLSAEVAKVRIKDGKALPGAVLFAAAQVEKPAFQGATLLAAEDTEVEEPADAAPETTDAAHLEVTAEVLPEDVTVTTPEGESSVYKPEPTPAEEPSTENTGEFAMTNESGAGATVPATLLANQPAAPKEVDLGTVFSSMAAVKSGMSNQTADAETFLGALSDIKVEASGGLTTAASGVLQPAWVGKLWQGKRYERKFLDLGTHLYGGIQLGGRKGFVLDQGTALVTAWSGNKTEIGSGTASTSVKSSTLRKYGYAADVAREWYDLEGGADVLQAFFEGVVDSYAKITDEDALADIIALIDTGKAGYAQALDTYPDEYPDALGALIQAIEAVQDAGDDPTFALVNPVAWKQLIYTPKDLIPEFVSFDFTTGGEGVADGKVRVRKATLTGMKSSSTKVTDQTKPAVIAGSSRGIEFREQGTTPIQIDALDIAKGGIDKAVVGYMETFVVRPTSFVGVGTISA